MPIAAVESLTERIIARSQASRSQYLRQMEAARAQRPVRGGISATNLAHAAAASPQPDKITLLNTEQRCNIGIVTAYNDMLSAHQPFKDYPDRIKAALTRLGHSAQIAGGVPAMCDGVTQGQTGMELSLFSRDTIALATAVSLSHNLFDGALYLGVCDKIVPGLLMAALRFGHLPAIFVPAGPMPTGISNSEKAEVRQRYAEGKASRDELLQSEARSYHAPGTCTFYGTANTNQILMEVLGLHIPGTAFVPPGTPLRDALTEAAAEQVSKITALGDHYRPLAQVVDEKAIVNAIVALLATGGSTNHTIHLVAMARMAGILIDWSDFAALSDHIPLLCRIYPNGKADINHFHAAGGCAFLIRELLDAGLLHHDVKTVMGDGLYDYTREPGLAGDTLAWSAPPSSSQADDVLRPATTPFAANGGLKLLQGNLGRAVIKVSAVPQSNWCIEAPAKVFYSQAELKQRFDAGELSGDFIAVLKFQGPKANGMPELHKLMPVLAVLQDRGQKVALVTDGRLSGASGKVPAAIHVTPECLDGGPLACIEEGDPLLLDAATGALAYTGSGELSQRTWVKPDLTGNEQGLGRELFSAFRQRVSGAEAGAISIDWIE